MRVLVACEYTGTVRDAFLAVGCDAMSCDLTDSEKPGPHYKGDVRDVLNDGWDMMIAHPPCTYLAVSGNRWTGTIERQEKRDAALDFFRLLLNADIEMIAVENPVGVANTIIRRPNFIMQPYFFGEDASKATCMWTKNLPKLKATKLIEPRYVNNKPRWGNQYDDGSPKTPRSERRGLERARTFPGIAKAFAEQWGYMKL